MISTNFLIQFVESIYSKLNTPMPQGQGNANHSTTRVVRAALGITDKMLINAGSKATPATDIHKYQESLNSADKVSVLLPLRMGIYTNLSHSILQNVTAWPMRLFMILPSCYYFRTL